MSGEAKTLVPQRFEGVGRQSAHPEVVSAERTQGARKDSGSDFGGCGRGCERVGDPLPDGIRWPSSAVRVEARGGLFFAHVHGKWRRVAEDFSSCLACGIRFARIAGKSAGNLERTLAWMEACGLTLPGRSAACRRAAPRPRGAPTAGRC